MFKELGGLMGLMKNLPKIREEMEGLQKKIAQVVAALLLHVTGEQPQQPHHFIPRRLLVRRLLHTAPRGGDPRIVEDEIRRRQRGQRHRRGGIDGVPGHPGDDRGGEFFDDMAGGVGETEADADLRHTSIWVKAGGNISVPADIAPHVKP